MNRFEKVCLLISTILLGNTLFFSIIKVPSWIEYGDCNYFSIAGFDNDRYYVGYATYTDNSFNKGIYLFKVTSKFKRVACMKANLKLLCHNNVKLYSDCF